MTELSFSRRSPPMQGGVEFDHLWFVTAEVRLYAFAAGSRDGPLLIPSYGFPEY
jgi:hypothetical protein